MISFVKSIPGWINKLAKLVWIMLTRDLRALIVLTYSKCFIQTCMWRKKFFLQFFDQNVMKYPNKTAIFFQDEKYTFKDLSEFSTKVSNWIEFSLNLGQDENREEKEFSSKTIDSDNDEDEESNISNLPLEEQIRLPQIGLFLGNIPELIGFQIGIARVRCSAVLFNIHHRRDTLVNAFRATNCKVLIIESKFLSAIQDIADRLPLDIRIFVFDRDPKIRKNPCELPPDYQGLSREDLINRNIGDSDYKFSSLLNNNNYCGDNPVKKRYRYQFSDPICYVFTSGTTGGNVKAASVDNLKLFLVYSTFAFPYRLGINDNIYICLPLYHLFAYGMLHQMTIGAVTVSLAEKFSAKKFWSDCIRFECTVALYIGETCRYLLAQPPIPDEINNHRLRLMIGLGLSRNIWPEFQRRFRIKQIAEYYGSTEGNIMIQNWQNVQGSCGFIPYYYFFLVKLFYHVDLYRVNPDTMELLRDKRGLCIPVKPGEIGMILGVIGKKKAVNNFRGYTSKRESTKKIVQNVRRKGDFAFVSGDLMEMDFYGNFYFKDRTGDTFRWKGENVSTGEIETIASGFIRHSGDTIIYGVLVPKHDGRAGMMATNVQNIDLDGFLRYITERVPDYAVPKFIRITKNIQTTSTMKYLKYPLQRSGFDPSKMSPGDRLFYLDRKSGRYQPLDSTIYQDIQSGKIQIG